MRTVPARRLSLLGGNGRLITTSSPEFTTHNLGMVSGVASGPWISANDPFAIPFALSAGGVVYQLGWRNGTGVMADSVDVGVYDTSWNRLVSTGSTARSGASTWQWVDVTDTALAHGRYYLVCANNGTSANNVFFQGSTANAALMNFLGCQSSSTDAFPLPNPLTDMALTTNFTRVPFLGIAMRSSIW